MKTIVSLTITFSLIFSHPAFAIWGSNNSQKQNTSQILQEYQNAVFNTNPIIEDFVQAPNFTDELKPKYDTGSSLLDKDPFFMRSQSWIEKQDSNYKNDNYMVAVSNNTISISRENWTRALNLHLPLSPLLNSAEYLFFSANSKEFFLAKQQVEPGEGVFFISKLELSQKYKDSFENSSGSALSRVPVYFMPLPHTGWTGKLTAFEWQEVDQIAIYNQDSAPLPVDLNDIRRIEKVQKLNLAMAQGQWLLAQKDLNLNPKQKMFPFPSPGATAAFGLFLTGIDLESSQGTLVQHKSFWQSRFITAAINQLFPKAYADGSVLDLLSPDFLLRIQVLSSILGGIFVASMGVKYTIYRDYFKKKYGNKSNSDLSKDVIAQSAQKESKSLYEKFKNELKGIFDVYSHALSVFSTFFSVNIIDALEYLGDRYATKRMGPKNGLVRRAFNSTLGWARNAAVNLAVNHKTFWLGAIVMGSVDSALVAFQLLYVTPYLLNSTSVGEMVNYDNSADTGSKARFVSSEIIRNIIGYLSHGAIGYAQEQRSLVQDRVKHDIDNELKRQGIDPFAKDVQARRESMIAERMNKAMKLRGLPDSDEFLFDTASIKQNAAQKQGFAVGSLGVGEDSAGHFLFESGRRGLAKTSLNKSLKMAETLFKNNPSETGKEVIKILKTLDSRWGQIKNSLRKDGLSQAKDVRKTLTLFSYGGNDGVEKWVEYLPQSVSSISNNKEAFEVVAQLYNTELYSVLDGDNKLFEKAETELKTFDGQNLQNLSNDQFVQALSKKIELYKAYKKDQKQSEIFNYQPQKKDFVAKLQEKRAHKKTLAKLQENGFTNSDSELYRATYRETFAQELAKVVGLHPKEESDFIKHVVEQAQSNTETQLQKEEEVRYRSNLSDNQKLEYEAWVYAENFLTSYRHLSVESDELLDATSPEMPGRFQKFRQKVVKFNHGGQLINKIFRLLETFTSTDSNAPGLGNLLDRSIPLWNDITHNIVRSARTWPYIATIGYLINYHVRQVHMDYPMWLFFISLGFTATAAVELLNRGMQNFGAKPMEGTWSKIKYSFYHSWLTYPIFIPMMAYTDPIVKWWSSEITTPLKETAKTCWEILTK